MKQDGMPSAPVEVPVDVPMDVRVDVDLQLDGGLRQFDGGLALAWTCG
jgi:hypothetical protein